MEAVSTTRSSSLNAAAPRSRSTLQLPTIGALAATIANVAVWAGGKAADVDFEATPPVGDPMQVGVVLVAVTTLLMFAVGWAVLAWAARRSRRWARVVTAAAGVVAVASAGGPLTTADGAASGVLLATMHLVTGAVFVAAAARAKAR